MSEKVNLKPYRLALEALLSHTTPAKLNTMLSHAAANLDDPKLREILINYIEVLDTYVRRDSRLLIIILNDTMFPNTENAIVYIKEVIDADESAWEIIASSYGWEPTG